MKRTNAGQYRPVLELDKGWIPTKIIKSLAGVSSSISFGLDGEEKNGRLTAFFLKKAKEKDAYLINFLTDSRRK